MRLLLRIVAAIPILACSPFLLLIAAVLMAIGDLAASIRRHRVLAPAVMPDNRAASVVIPNWNGRELLAKYVPSILAALAGNSDNELVIVDNGSTDGSASFIREAFPQVRLLELPQNLGFGGGSNAGFRAARNDIVVLLNSDMRVDPDFLQPLLDSFVDAQVFAVSCQIYFTDPGKQREETGLTEGWWEDGGLRVRHVIDDKVDRLFPCFYGGGGSCAFDRRKFLELGGFDSLLAPFYLEDTDLGYMAWKRGWKVLYQPRSVVYHEHRGTIGKTFSEDYIQGVLHKNYVLFVWKNIHDWHRLLAHFAYAWAGTVVSSVFGPSLERATFAGLWRAVLQLPSALRSRRRARLLSTVDDTEAFRRPLGGYYRDRFLSLPPAVERPRVLFVSPYPVCPPVHGGAVFMAQTCHHLVPNVDLHLVVNIDSPQEEAAHETLARHCASAEFVVRLEGKPKQPGSLVPSAVREFANRNLHWLIHRKIFLDQVDVLQLEYLPMAQYSGHYRQIASVLFEHDIYFQSIARLLRRSTNAAPKLASLAEYMRALRYELRALPAFDRIQVCSQANADYLLGFAPTLAGRIDTEYRAGIDVSRYTYNAGNRVPDTILFVGSFRHLPNLAALEWLVNRVLPRVLEQNPRARLVVVGSAPPARHVFPDLGTALELRGFVEDVREPLSTYSLFVCPILSGSGVRVKLLEAFASGIPCVSTTLGAEGLAEEDGEICALADEPAAFAGRIVELLGDASAAAELAARARAAVETKWDIRHRTRGLVKSYQEILAAKRQA